MSVDIERRDINKNMEIKLAKLEQKVDDLKIDVSEMKADVKEFINSADGKYALKEDVATLKKIVWFIIGSSVGFLVWALQEYLRIAAK